MATWVAPIDSETDPDAPLTSNLGKRWDNNTIAIAEGAAGAPRVSPSAQGETVLSGSTTGDLTISGFSGYAGASISLYYSNSVSQSGTIQISLSDDGVSFSTPVDVADYADNASGSVSIFVNFSDGAVTSVSTGGALASDTTPATSADITHIRFSLTGLGTVTMSALSFVNAGTVA